MSMMLAQKAEWLVPISPSVIVSTTVAWVGDAIDLKPQIGHNIGLQCINHYPISMPAV